MQAGDWGPVRWLRRVKRGGSPAAAETSLCFIKTVYWAFLTSPFCSITAFSSRTASHSFQLDFIWTKREGHTVTCLASWKHSHSKPQRGVGTRVCPQSCSSFKVTPKPHPSSAPQTTTGSSYWVSPSHDSPPHDTTQAQHQTLLKN